MSDITERKHPIFRFWEAPSFDPIISWTILVDLSSEYKSPMLRRVIGSKYTGLTFRDDFTKMRDNISEKNARVEDYLLKPHEFEALGLHRMIPLQILPFEDYGGCDGTIYGIQNCTGMQTLYIDWWETGPDGWRELIDWATRTRKYLSWLIDRFDLDFKDINQIHPPDYKIWGPVDEE